MTTDKIDESIRKDLIDLALDVLKNTYRFDVSVSSFDRISISQNNNATQVEFKNTIRFVPEKSTYYYSAVVFLNTNNIGFGFESNPINYSSNCQPEFFFPSSSQQNEIDSVVNYLVNNHCIKEKTFFDKGGSLVIYAKKLKYDIEIRDEQNRLRLELLKEQLL